MKALLIGGTGNISLSVSRLLLEKGWDLAVLNRGNKKDLLPKARHIEADMADEAAVAQALQGERFDVVAQFIAFRPEQVERDIRLFSGKCRQYIFISSASCYQKPPRSPLFTESTPLHNPYWTYSQDKIACEEALMKAYREQDFPVTIVRPSHTYGERALPLAVHGQMGAWQVLERILNEKPILVPGDGSTLWTVTTSADFARGFVGLMGQSRAIGEAFHITSDEWLTWNQIHQTVCDILDRPYKPCYVPSELLSRIPSANLRGPLFGDKMNCVILDNSKVKAFVPGFHCPTRFEEGAKASIHNFLTDKSLQRPDPAFDQMSDQVAAIMEKAGEAFASL